MVSSNTIARLENDPDFRDRLRIAAAMFGVESPDSWVYGNALKVALLEEVNKRYDACLTAQPYHSRPGYDSAVIPDEVLAAAVAEVIGG